ncbi:hypothetical protein BO71DRAFT_136547 [Aspergillus ellipticus CBS 707.79]|uniref:Uncharacterized protein n=1 Tax=Aspergillus ellipticus CBS 707.79 TaxID=1448320 RepID=A0A319DBP6_9EURO|nr:hypothetical protein BO71DRAFT_136547 [Aspergillus ellipticus CBS 707.79]
MVEARAADVSIPAATREEAESIAPFRAGRGEGRRTPETQPGDTSPACAAANTPDILCSTDGCDLPLTRHRQCLLMAPPSRHAPYLAGMPSLLRKPAPCVVTPAQAHWRWPIVLRRPGRARHVLWPGQWYSH